MGKAVGIDLGTTSSGIAAWADGEIILIPNSHGSTATPSVVAFTEEGGILVGQEALDQSILNPRGTVHSVKRLMGRSMNEAEKHLAGPSRVSERGLEAVRFSMGKQDVAPEEVVAHLLKKLADDASAHVAEKITEAVITVPACFGDARRQAVLDAGEIAGLKVLRLINEPTAAAVAHHFLDPGKPQTLLVLDLGGGHLDVSLVDVSEGVCEVRAAEGDDDLGGDDFRDRLVRWLVEEFGKETGVDVSRDLQSLRRLSEACERAKCELSQVGETEVRLPHMPHGSKEGTPFRRRVSRALLESLTEDLLDRCRNIVKQVLHRGRVSSQDVDEILLAGGGTRMPAVQRLVREFSGGGQPLRGVDPRERVVAGAAALGAMRDKKLQDLILLDVASHSVGMEMRGGAMKRLIEKDTTLPARREEIFGSLESTEGVEVVLLEGEDERAEVNRELGRFRLERFPWKTGAPISLSVTFDMDVNGIMHVTVGEGPGETGQPFALEKRVNLSRSEVARLTSKVGGVRREP